MVNGTPATATSSGATLCASCPVLYLLIWGEHDPFGSLAAARQVAGRLREARVEVVGVGHLPWVDAPERCGDLVRAFLAET